MAANGEKRKIGGASAAKASERIGPYRENLPAKAATFYREKGYLFYGAAAFVIVLCVLFAGGTIGLSNNGDYSRAMYASSLDYTYTEAHNAFRFIDGYTIALSEDSATKNVCKILFGKAGLANYPSIQVVPIRISVVLNLICNKLSGGEMDVYRIGILGVLYAVLYALALVFLLAQFRLRRLWADVAAKCAVLFVLCDVGYVGYFNSFYGEALQIITLVFCAGCLLRVLLHEPDERDVFRCAAAAVLFGWSKFFNIPAAVLLALLLEGVLFFKTKRRAALAAGLASVAVLGAVYCIVPTWMDTETTYNAVFSGAVRGVEEQTGKEYLEGLGLPAEMICFQNTTYYVDGVQNRLETEGYAQALRALSKKDIAVFYAKHPARLLQLLDISVQNCGFIRPFYLSNYGPGQPRITQAHRFSLWSDLRLKLGFDSWAGNLGVYAAFLLAVWMQLRARRGPRMALTVLFSAALLGYGFVVPVLSNGAVDITKHQFLFVELADFLLLYAFAAGLNGLSAHRTRTRAAVCLMLAVCCLAASPLHAQIVSIVGETRAHDRLEPGAYVRFGEYGGKMLTWRVTGVAGGTAALLCTESVCEKPFSAGSDSWETSSLRAWLNGPFLQGFSVADQSRLQKTAHSVLLSHETKSRASAGSNDFYCTQIPALADWGSGSAYRCSVSDEVCLPDISMLSESARRGERISSFDCCWLDTPYFYGGYLLRCVFPDGYIYIREATAPAGVRPVIHIAAETSLLGSGSKNDPFVLN